MNCIVLMLMLCLSVTYINAKKKNSVVMTLIVRDEAVNIKSNLPLWATIIDNFVFMVDERTSDGTEDAIAHVLGKRVPYQIVYYNFSGFGPARTKSLNNAWKYFPQATHVWIADPDWRPDLETINIDDLDLVHDAFRFLIYDRSGISTRRCDWLLRHREGLAMRYHLHEVLDIGEYHPVPVSWVVREIEQQGSWHTTVGHGHSMSAQRYVFDLELLAKDLTQYGHDPHVHHYLGITHQAYAEKLLHSNRFTMTEEVQFHIAEAIKYLKLRILSTYTAEFNEQRWACMYSLGIIYATYLDDQVNGVRWLHACHDFSPKQTECALAIVHIYHSFGQLGQAIRMMQVILQTEHEERAMLNHFKHWVCDVPISAVSILSMSALYGVMDFSVDDAKYLRLVAGMASTKKCADYGVSLSKDAIDKVQQISRSQGLSPASLNDFNHLCRDKSVQAYIISKKYTLHPCETITKEFNFAKQCKPFGKFVTSPSERHELLISDSFSGAASLADIVHHAHAGFAGRVNANPGNGGFYRVLFAEHFNPDNAFSLIAESVRSSRDARLKIVFLSSNPDFEEYFTGVVRGCLGDIPILNRLTFVALKSGQRMRDALKPHADGSESSYFDYVEYFNGMSLDSAHSQHLSDLKEVIGKHGVIGVTMFTRNVYQQQIRRMIEGMNHTAHVPLSSDPIRMVKGVLKSNDLGHFTKDDMFLRALLSSSLATYSKKEAENVVSSAGLKVFSWVPTAIMNPYDLINNEEVQRFNSYGMSEEDFTEIMLCNFRATLYVGRLDTNLPGKANIQDTQHFLDHSMLIDRAGGLSNVFKDVAERAKTGSSMTFDIPVDTHSRARIIVTMIMQHVAMAPLVMLSSKPTLSQMLAFNTKALGVNHGSIAVAHLMALLTTLEKFNYVTLWTEGFPNQSKGRANLEKSFGDSVTQSNVASSSRDSKVHASGLRIGDKDSQRMVKFADESVTTVADSRDDMSSIRQLETRIAGLKKMGFSDDTIAKMMATIPSQGVAASSSSPGSGIASGGVVTGSIHSVKTSDASSTPADSKTTAVDVEKRIAGLKKMGFSDDTIAKMMATIPSQGVAASSSSPGSGIASGGVVTGSIHSVKTSDASSTPADSKTTAVDVEKRIAGLKKMGFSDDTIAKMMATIPSQGVAASSSSPGSGIASGGVVTGSIHSVKTSGASSTPADSKTTAVDVEKRIAGLKKMGFSDDTIAKMMATIPSQGVAASSSSPGSGIASGGVVTGSIHSVKTSDASSTPADSKTTAVDVEKRIAGLKKMGFSDDTIAKMMATIPSQGVAASSSSPGSGIASGGVVTGSIHSVKTSDASSTPADSKTTAVDVEKRIAGLKKMGFSDDTIAKMMATIPSQGVAASSSSPGSGIASGGVVTGSIHSVKTSGASSTPADSKTTAVDVEKRIAGLKKMGFSDDTIAKMMATIPSQGVAASSSSPGSGIASGGVVTGNSGGDRAGSGTDKPGAEKVRGKALVSNGGLFKQKRFVPESDDSDDNSLATSDADSIPPVCRFPGVNGGSLCEPYLTKGEDADIEDDDESAMPLLKGLSSSDSLIAKIIEKLIRKKGVLVDNSDPQKQIAFPAFQPRQSREHIKAGSVAPPSHERILTSIRNPKCEDYVTEPGHCSSQVPGARRTTSGIKITSRPKLKFDIEQIQYIIGHEKNVETGVMQNAMTALTVLFELIFTKSVQLNTLTALSSSQYEIVRPVLNRLLNLAEDENMKSIGQVGAMGYLKSVMTSLENVDFFVVDDVLETSALAAFSRMLLTSTFWFDATNGVTFVAHFDDGMTQLSFFNFGQDLEDVISSEEDINAYVLRRYYAVALDNSEETLSAVSMVDPGDIHVVVWLNGNTTTSDDEDQLSHGSGILVLSTQYTKCLQSHGINMNRRTHSDFASRMGSLRVNILSVCSTHSFELIPQKSNRLVVIAPGQSFCFMASNNDDVTPQSSFEDRIVLALVYVFSKN